jgi:hypothetical protein
MKEPIWFWVNPSTGSTLSPKFATQNEAEKWFDDVVTNHSATYDLLDRVMYGKFYYLRGKVDVGDLVSSTKVNDCPFDIHLEDDILVTEVLGLDALDARSRVEEFFEVLEWLDD